MRKCEGRRGGTGSLAGYLCSGARGCWSSAPHPTPPPFHPTPPPPASLCVVPTVLGPCAAPKKAYLTSQGRVDPERLTWLFDRLAEREVWWGWRAALVAPKHCCGHLHRCRKWENVAWACRKYRSNFYTALVQRVPALRQLAACLAEPCPARPGRRRHLRSVSAGACWSRGARLSARPRPRATYAAAVGGGRSGWMAAANGAYVSGSHVGAMWVQLWHAKASQMHVCNQQISHFHSVGSAWENWRRMRTWMQPWRVGEPCAAARGAAGRKCSDVVAPPSCQLHALGRPSGPRCRHRLWRRARRRQPGRCRGIGAGGCGARGAAA